MNTGAVISLVYSVLKLLLYSSTLASMSLQWHSNDTSTCWKSHGQRNKPTARKRYLIGTWWLGPDFTYWPGSWWGKKQAVRPPWDSLIHGKPRHISLLYCLIDSCLYRGTGCHSSFSQEQWRRHMDCYFLWSHVLPGVDSYASLPAQMGHSPIKLPDRDIAYKRDIMGYQVSVTQVQGFKQNSVF